MVAKNIHGLLAKRTRGRVRVHGVTEKSGNGGGKILGGRMVSLPSVEEGRAESQAFACGESRRFRRWTSRLLAPVMSLPIVLSVATEALCWV